MLASSLESLLGCSVGLVSPQAYLMSPTGILPEHPNTYFEAHI